LGNFFKRETNKLVNLNIAKKCGLDIPETLISSDNEKLLNFCSKNQSVTKPIGEAMSIRYKDKYYRMLTKMVKNGDIEHSDVIFPTLVQNMIDKEFEIRIFVVYKEIFAMAIFSQNNEKTNIDFRNYDHEHKNRMIPFRLPDDISQKIFLFMQEAGLDTGSIDMIKTFDNKYLFLEVNPCGNIEMTSVPYNYVIEKRIAEIIKNCIQDGK
jgi:glutathione synthase/RimK-type ligase-like ATP-grasp enzyme